MEQEIWDIFEQIYLDESQKSVKLCMEITELIIKEQNPDLLPLPPYRMFIHKVRELPDAYVRYFRHVNKLAEYEAFPKGLKGLLKQYQHETRVGKEMFHILAGNKDKERYIIDSKYRKFVDEICDFWVSAHFKYPNTN